MTKIKAKRDISTKAPKGFLAFCLTRGLKLFVLIAFAVAISAYIYHSTSDDYEGLLSVRDGYVVAVDMEKLSGGQISLEVRGELGDSSIQKEVILRHDVQRNQKTDVGMSELERLSVEISKMVREINRGEAQMTELPQLTPDGAKLSWVLPEKGMEYLLPLFFPILIMFFSYRDTIDREKQSRKRERESILRELPNFSNKLVLLMESGIIYDEAVERISELGEGKVEKIFLEAIRKAKTTNGRVEKIVGDYAKENNISELSRLISIIYESRERGTDLREKLIGEAEILWEKRKRQAEEQGKLADTKLALPLGMMLVSLLLVTAAPALMQF